MRISAAWNRRRRTAQAAFAVALCCVTSAPARAALADIDFRYAIDFVSPTLRALGLAQGGSMNGSARFDEGSVDPVSGTVTIDAIAPPGGPRFALRVGVLAFTQADDAFGGPRLRLAADGGLAGLSFEPSPILLDSGDYRLVFAGNQFALTPAGNTVDFLVYGYLQPIPEPAEWRAMAVGLMVLGVILARRARRVSVA
jgi:hypothetical protein